MFLSQPPAPVPASLRRWQRSANAAIQCEGGITMGAFYEACRAQNLDKTPDAWHASYVGSDGDWSPREAEESAHVFAGYVFSRTGRDGSMRALATLGSWSHGAGGGSRGVVTKARGGFPTHGS
ncbi:F-box domain protein [Teratosphaeria destructans]|uniref:F-box domain protein n=1 Tax=Teratosphaeria destructans TaxID=418781 RepID=A0A9W7SXC6_9PEZI|nr:F-box domain protein [Teratosphaeria destructans]